MKKPYLLIVLLLLVITSCSVETEPINETSSENTIINLDDSRKPLYRVSVTGNSSLSLMAILHSNGNVSGHWRDSDLGLQVDIDCVSVEETADGMVAVLSGTVSRGPLTGQPFVVKVIDGPTDKFTPRLPTYSTCETPPGFGWPNQPEVITSGQVKIM